jgi:hypothetical protein
MNALKIEIFEIFDVFVFSLCFVGKFWQVNGPRYSSYFAVSNRPKIVVRRGFRHCSVSVQQRPCSYPLRGYDHRRLPVSNGFPSSVPPVFGNINAPKGWRALSTIHLGLAALRSLVVGSIGFRFGAASSA